MVPGMSLSCRMQTHLIIVIKILRLLAPLKLAAMTSFAVNESAAEARLEKSGNVSLFHNSVLLNNEGSMVENLKMYCISGDVPCNESRHDQNANQQSNSLQPSMYCETRWKERRGHNLIFLGEMSVFVVLV